MDYRIEKTETSESEGGYISEKQSEQNAWSNTLYNRNIDNKSIKVTVLDSE